MNMSTVLIVLKYTSTAIGGITGVWGIASETKDKSGKLTAWGRFALILAVLSFGVSLFSQALEQVHDGEEQALHDQAHDAEVKSLNKDLSVAQDTITLLRTQFKTVSLSVVYPLPSEDPRVVNLAREIQSKLPTSERGPQPLHQILDGITSIAGIAFVHPEQLHKGYLQTLPPLEADLETIGHSAITLSISRKGSSNLVTQKAGALGQATTDYLEANFLGVNKPYTLCCEPDRTTGNNKLSIIFSLREVTSEECTGNGGIAGIGDLGGAHASMNISPSVKIGDPSYPFIIHLPPPRARVSFGKYQVSLEFPSVQPRPVRTWTSFNFESDLPDSEDILSGKAVKFDVTAFGS